MYKQITELKVRYGETDQMGIVHHSNYYHWFEAGRSEFMEEIGFHYKGLEENGLLTPLVESKCKYKVGATYGDTVIIETYISDIKAAKVIFSYNVIRKEDNVLLAKGKTVHGIVNKEFKIINFKKTFPQVYKKFLEVMEG